MASNVEETKEKQLLFTYGSNICERRIKDRGVEFLDREGGLVRGFRLAFNVLWRDGFACTTILPDDDFGAVYGALYLFPRESFVILDRCLATEGKYERALIQVEKGDGKTVEALVYVARKEHVQSGLKPSVKYLDVMLEAQDIIPKEYAAYLRSLKNEN